MRNLFRCVFLITALLNFAPQGKSQNITGTDFWFTIPETNSPSHPTSINQIYVVSQYFVDSAYMDIPAYNQRIYFSVEPGNFKLLEIENSQGGQDAYVEVRGQDLNRVVEKGVHIVSPLPVSVHYMNRSIYVSDGEPILPNQMLGTKYVMAFRNNGLSKCTGANQDEPSDPNYGYVTATEDNTQVTVETWDDFGPITYSLNLDAGEVYSWRTQNDCAGDYPGTQITCSGLTGTVVTADKKVYVMANSPCATIGVAGNCDNLIASYLPIDQYGTMYVCAQTIERLPKAESSTISNTICLNDDLKGSGDYVEITGVIGDQVQIISRLGTETVTIPAPAGTFTNYGYGSYLKEIPESLPDDVGEANMQIIALDNPIQVTQYNKGRHADDVDEGDLDDPTDPEVQIIFPPTTWEDSYFFYPVRFIDAQTQFVNLVVEDVGTPSPTTLFEINDVPVTEPFQQIPGTNYKFTRVEFPVFVASKVINKGGHKFGIYFFSSGERESVFFSGAYGPITNLDLCEQGGTADVVVEGSRCLGNTLSFIPKIYTFTRPDSLEFFWDFDDGTTSDLEFPKKQFSQTGIYDVKLSIKSSDTCVLDFEKRVYVNDVVVSPELIADTTCLGDSLELRANPSFSPGGKQIIQYSNVEGAPLDIPDGGVNNGWDGEGSLNYLTSTVNVDGFYPVPARIDSVCINLSHELITDINIFLFDPSGQKYTLLKNPKTIGRTNLRKTCFSPTATDNIADINPPYTGSYIPEGGTFPTPKPSPQINGNWILRIGDEEDNFVGQLEDWSIYISSQMGLKSVSWSPDIPLNEVDQSTGSVSIKPTQSKMYTVEVEDLSGCTSTDSIFSTVLRQAYRFASTDTLLCNIYDSINLFNRISDDRPLKDGTWEILNGSTIRLKDSLYNFIGAQGGGYEFRYTEETFCGPDSARFIINVNEAPNVGVNALDSVCEAKPAFDLFPYLGSNADVGGQWSSTPPLPSSVFSGGIFDPNQVPFGDYFFYYKIIVESCPIDSSEVNIRVSRPPYELSAEDTLLCNIHPNFNLFNTITDPRMVGDGQWLLLNGDPTRLNNSQFNTDGLAAGSYNFKYLEETFCGQDSALVTVHINELPNLGTDNDDDICDTEAPVALKSYLGSGIDQGGYWTVYPTLSSPSFDGEILTPTATSEDLYAFYYQRPVQNCPADSAEVIIRLNHQPYAGVSGDTTICEADAFINLYKVLDNNPEETGEWTDLDNTGGLDGNFFKSLGTPSLPNSIFRFRYDIVAKEACVDVSSTATITVSKAPEVTFNADFPTLCKDSTVTIDVTLAGNGPFNISISDGFTSYPNPAILPVASTFSFQATLSKTTDFKVVSLTDNTALRCSNALPESFKVRVYEPIQSKLVEEDCILNANGFSFDGFIPVIELSGGDGSNYRYDLFIDDVLVKSNKAAQGNVHRGDTLPNGVEYAYRFYDGSNCPDVEAFFHRRPRKYCECATFVGFMDIDPLEFCEYETAVAPFVDNSFLEPEDTVYYILHDRAGIVLGNRLDSNAIPEFAYHSGLQYEKTYYISAIAGDSLLGGIDPADTCVSVSDGTPIVFHQQPDINLLENSGAICEGSFFELPYQAIGKAPFRLNVLKIEGGISTSITYTLNAHNGIIKLNPVGDAIYRVISISDANTDACVKNIGEDIIIDVFDLPRVSFTQDPEIAICEGDFTDLNINISGGLGPFRITYLKNGVAFGNPVVTSSRNLLLTVSEQGRYQIGSIDDIGSGCPGVTINASINLLVKKQPIADAGASPIEVCGRAVRLEAMASFGQGRWQQPLTGYSYNSPNNPFSWVVTSGPGEYSFVWEEENAPCPISRDTVFATFFPQPVAYAGEDTVICGLEYTLQGEASLPSNQASGYWLYEGNGNVVFDNVSSPNAKVTVGSSGTYQLLWRESAAGKCVDFDTVNIVFSDFLRAAVVDTICLDNGNKYQFVININGGDPNSLTVNGQLIGSLPYITPPLNSGQSYKFGFSDLSSCGYSDTLRTSYGCPCISDAGELQNQDTLKLCFGDKLIAQSKQDFIKDSDDTLLYILHTRGDDTLGGILASSGINGLNTDNLQLTPGKVYYLSRVVGTRANNNLGLNTNDYCLSVAPGMPVTFNKKAQAIISLTSQVCEGESLILKVNGGGVGPYTFSLRDTPGGAGTMYSVNSGDEINLNYPVGNYTFYISNFVDQGNPCTELLNDRLNASVKPLPSGDVMFEPIVCRFTSTLFEVRNTQARVTWDFGDGSELVEGKTAGHSYTAAGNYVVTTTLVDKVTGCLREYTNAITVQRKPDVRILVDGTLDFDGVKCPGENAFISLATFDPSTTYQWFVNGVERTPFTTAFLQVIGQQSIQIKLKATTTGGCIDERTVTIKVANPTAELQLPNEVCNRDELTLRFRDANQHVNNYEWIVTGAGVNTYDGNPVTFMVDEPAGTNVLQVELELKAKEGCVNTISKDVRVKQVLADFIAPLEICLNETANILNNAVNVKKLRYTFGDGSSSTSQVTIPKRYAQPGLYTITQTVENQEEGCTDVVQKQIRVHGLPKVQDYNFEVCVNTQDTLRVSGGEFYNWFPPTRLNENFGPEVLFSAFADSVPQVIDYLVSVTNSQNCSDTSKVTVKIIGLDSTPVFPFGVDTLLTIGDSFRLSLPNVPGLIYEWSPEEYFACTGCSSQMLYGIEDVEYLVEVDDIFGCTDRAISVRVRINEEPRSLDVPDAFTPNDDGINDVIYPQGWGVEEYESFRIYNRYGELIFEGSGSRPAWNGLIGDIPAAADTYVFVVRAKMYNQRKRQVLQGSFMLIR